MRISLKTPKYTFNNILYIAVKVNKRTIKKKTNCYLNKWCKLTINLINHAPISHS